MRSFFLVICNIIANFTMNNSKRNKNHFSRLFSFPEVALRHSSELQWDVRRTRIDSCIYPEATERRWVSKHERWWWSWLWIVEIFFLLFFRSTSNERDPSNDGKEAKQRKNITQFMDTTNWKIHEKGLIYISFLLDFGFVHSSFVISSQPQQMENFRPLELAGEPSNL